MARTRPHSSPPVSFLSMSLWRLFRLQLRNVSGLGLLYYLIEVVEGMDIVNKIKTVSTGRKFTRLMLMYK
jgi:hypothetical protein